MTHPAPDALVFMGVAGCGKSTLGEALARRGGRVWLEGDDFHGAANRSKMAQGVPLTDVDRTEWLAALCDQMRRHPTAFAACSALKRAYRERLRAAVPGLRFVFLDIDPAEAARRVSTRSGHFFNASLMASQFATLEPPTGEPGVLRLDATLPLRHLEAQVGDWLHLPAAVAGTSR